jgi:hypothetical protein
MIRAIIEDTIELIALALFMGSIFFLAVGFGA